MIITWSVCLPTQVKMGGLKYREYYGDKVKGMRLSHKLINQHPFISPFHLLWFIAQREEEEKKDFFIKGNYSRSLERDAFFLGVMMFSEMVHYITSMFSLFSSSDLVLVFFVVVAYTKKSALLILGRRWESKLFWGNRRFCWWCWSFARRCISCWEKLITAGTCEDLFL